MGDYFLSVYGTFVPLLSSDHNRYIALQVDQIQNSVVTLVFAADDIRFVTNTFVSLLGQMGKGETDTDQVVGGNRSPGIIKEASVEDFEAQSKDGKLRAEIMNTGSITADYTV